MLTDDLQTILPEESDSDEDVNHLSINEYYAKAYELRKEKQELARLKEKYGSDAEEDDDDEEEDSEDAESEDEDGEELTPAVDAAILRTLARIKKKDPSIYEQGKGVFDEEIQKSGDLKLSSRSGKQKNEKPLTIRQHALQSVINPTSRSPSPEPLTHVKEQELLRNETITAFHTAVDAKDDDDEEEEDDLLVLREKTKDELEREEEEYREFLKREVGEDLGDLITVEVNDAEEEIVESKKKKKGKTKDRDKKKEEEEDQEFLMNYILNRGWIDRSTKRLPTYKEITGSSKSKGKGKAIAAFDDSTQEESENEASGSAPGFGEDIEDDDEFEEVAELFESSYNFRFEEPGATEIARHPRNLDSTIRREENHRKEVRERRKERKEMQKLQKKEEVKRLKSLKMKEIREKLERIGKEGGKSVDETEAIHELDLEGDWDPATHDAQMSKIYGHDADEADEADEEKPTWDDDIDITDIVPPEPGPSERKKKKKKKKKHQDEDEQDEGVDLDEMDADVQRNVRDQEWDGTEEMRKRKLDEYMDELYGLEFNDMIGDMPTRFKYAKVQPQSFALTPVEILMATDAELNQYMGLRKFAPYRKDGSNWDKNRAARLKELKTTLQERKAAFGAGDDGSQAPSEPQTKKRKGKKERMKAKAAAGMDFVEAQDEEDHQPPNKKHRSSREEVQPVNGSDKSFAPSKSKRRNHEKSSELET